LWSPSVPPVTGRLKSASGKNYAGLMALDESEHSSKRPQLEPARAPGRLVIVSNRVPARRGTQAGGLAVALQEALKPGSLWFGWSGKRSTKTGTEPQLEQAGGVTYATIDLAEQDYQHFYVGFSNSTLWPLLHFRLGLIDFKRADYEGYQRVNRAYAEALAPLLKPDDMVWIHDYHLIPLARELRALGVKNRLGFFLHVPFVPASVFSVLPPATELLRALCDYDVIGFQTEEHRQDFANCLTHMLGSGLLKDGTVRLPGSQAQAVVVPIGIDAKHFAHLADRAMRDRNSRIVRCAADRPLIIGVDRLDYSKGLPHRFEAFGRLLDGHQEHRGKVSYLQIAATSREDVSDYQTLRRELDESAGNINGRFAEFDWVPLRYMTRAVGRHTLAGLYRIAKIGLVTPLRDGMNLVAKEYIAAQDPEDPGVLILSRFAGAAEELADALLVNPYDPDEIADALQRAITMPLAERRQRFEQLSARVFLTTAQSYCWKFLDYLVPNGDPGLMETPRAAANAYSYRE
jgi:trehalose 6-phosphate synthase